MIKNINLGNIFMKSQGCGELHREDLASYQLTDTITPFIALSGGDHPASVWSVAELTVSWELPLYFSSNIVQQYHPPITLKCFSAVPSINSSSTLHSYTEFT